MPLALIFEFPNQNQHARLDFVAQLYDKFVIIYHETRSERVAPNLRPPSPFQRCLRANRRLRAFSAPPATPTAPTAAPIERSITQPGNAAPIGQTGIRPGLFGGGLLGGLAAGFLGAGLFGLLFGHGFFGGMAGFASIIGLLLQVVLVVIVARLVFAWWQRRNMPTPAYATAHPVTGHSFGGLSGMLGGAANVPPTGDPLTIAKSDYDAFERLLGDIQADYSTEDLSALSAKVTGVEKAIRSVQGGNESPILRLNYQRNTVDVDDAVAQLQQRNAQLQQKRHAPIKAVIMVPAYRAAVMIYTSVSFVGSTALADELMLLGKKYATGVIVTQVVPAVDGHSSLVLDYKSALAKYFPGQAPDYVSLEGYVDANILIAALQRSGPQLDTEKLVGTLENLQDLDIGLGTPVTFNRSDHQGVHKVWGTQLDETGHYQPIDLQ